MAFVHLGRCQWRPGLRLPRKIEVQQFPEQVVKAFIDQVKQRLPGIRRVYERADKIIRKKEEETSALVRVSKSRGFDLEANETRSGNQRQFQLPERSVDTMEGLLSFTCWWLNEATMKGVYEEIFDETGKYGYFTYKDTIFLDVDSLRVEIHESWRRIRRIEANILALKRLARMAVARRNFQMILIPKGFANNSDPQGAATTGDTGNQNHDS